MQTDPCSVNAAYAPGSSFTMSLRSTTQPLYFWELVNCHGGNFSTSAAFASRIFTAWRKGTHLCTRLQWSTELNPFSAMWPSCSFDRVSSKRSLKDSWASTMHAYFDPRVLDSPQISLHWWFLTSQGTAAPISKSNFRALSSFGLTVAHWCFSFRWPDLDMPDEKYLAADDQVWWLLTSCEPLSRRHPFGDLSFNIVSYVNPVHESDQCRSTSMFQQSSMRLSCNTYKFVSVVLVTSM